MEMSTVFIKKVMTAGFSWAVPARRMMSGRFSRTRRKPSAVPGTAAVREKLHDFPNVAVPDIHWETSSSEVLTMEYMEGVSISDIGALDAMGIDRAQLATDLIDVFAEMILYDGLFHADPHPGNVHVQADGTIVLLDFGMMGTITDDMRKGFMGVVTAIFSSGASFPPVS